MSFSGPGELDLFGQRIDTKVHFAGPVPPRLRLTHITLSQQLTEFTHTADGHGARDLRSALLHIARADDQALRALGG